jgi:hypothetical protein
MPTSRLPHAWPRAVTIIAIDPGDKQSAVVHYDPIARAVIESQYADNDVVLACLRQCQYDRHPTFPGAPTLVIEMIASYGMPVGAEVFETCVWIGRFLEAWGPASHMLYRRDVKLHLCGSMRAKDGNSRAALLDKFGGSKACGTKKHPGPLRGISGDKWAALAVAVCFAETRMEALAPRHTPDLFAGAA